MIRRVVNSLRDFGAAETLCMVLHRLRIISFRHTFSVFIKDLDSLENSGAALAEAGKEKTRLTFREIFQDELADFEFPEEMYSKETLQEHFRRGYRFFAALKENQIVSINGVHTRSAHWAYIGKSLVRLPENWVYFNFALTVPASRNQRIGSVLRQYTLRTVRQEGYQTMLAAAFIENKKAAYWHVSNRFECGGLLLT